MSAKNALPPAVRLTNPGSINAKTMTKPGGVSTRKGSDFLSHKVFLKSFCRSQLCHESVNLSFTITNIKNKLMELYGH